MSSILPYYEYDIFISYRQKDNKHDSWVSEFVENLKSELESTFKEEISVYFDINPHDGLLETHNVDASLREKLKCLIFIPVISQTYCDVHSFAWQHEFIAFKKTAREDTFGLDIRLAGGNVTSRILPVKIHDLDAEDKKLLEDELEGFIRGVDFIYKEPGVNRPLRPEDDENKNLNNTKYRNQINKVANAVKEIINALKKHNQKPEEILAEAEIEKPPLVKHTYSKILIGSLIALFLITSGYLIFKLISQPSKPLEKSIAVLPFFNDSPDEGNSHIINGIMDEILNNLQAIKDLRVISRTSVEQFRGNSRPTLPEIAKRLNVNYIVEGSGQKYGNSIRLRVQLIEAARDKHLWAKSFENDIKETKDIFLIQSQIAQSIAGELKTLITPEERKLIEKSPSASLPVYDFYSRGRDEHLKYRLDNSDIVALKNAEYFYQKALANDSTFARAYSGLAIAYIDMNTYSKTMYFSRNYLDSALFLADKALYYDSQLAEAYYARAAYYYFTGNTQEAAKEAYKALDYNPNYWEVYMAAGMTFFNDFTVMDFVEGLKSLQKASSINKGKELPSLLRDLGNGYGAFAGFTDKADYFNGEAFKLDKDSIAYFRQLAISQWLNENFTESADYYNKCLAIDSSEKEIFYSLGEDYLFTKNYTESLKYYEKYEKQRKAAGQIRLGGLNRIGYAYWKNGFKKEAQSCINEQKKLCEEAIKMKRAYAGTLGAYYDLASVCAFEGNKEMAIENLKIWAKMPVCPLWWIVILKNDPLLDPIRNDAQFQKIFSEMEAKYKAEHERVKKWIAESGN
jgi:TolB-like protein